MDTLAAPAPMLRPAPSVDRPVEAVRPVKLAGKLVGFFVALPHLALYLGGCVTMGREKAFRSSSERIAGLAGQLGVYARQWFYSLTLREVGDDVYFGFMSMFSKRDVRIGDRVYIGRFCSIGLADLEEEAVLADGVQVLSGRHHHATGEGSLQHGDVRYERVTVGRRAWLGANAVVMANIGESAIVGAGAVVAKPVEPEAKVVGVPAKPLSADITIPAQAA